MLPTSGPLSLFAIFKEIYGRESNIGERVSFHALVAASNLTNKSLPCPFSRFYGYSHGPRNNVVMVRVVRTGTSSGILSATAQYAVQSRLTITARYQTASGVNMEKVFELPNSATTASVDITLEPGQISAQPHMVSATITPTGDSTYYYIAQI